MKTQKQDLGKVSLTCNGTWDAGKQYDRLCIVNDGNFASYISKKDVPIGTVLSDERFWQPIANLRDDIKIDYETFKKEWLELLASIQIKLRSARVVVANEEARNNLTWLEVAVGCEVYELDTQLTYILDSIVPVINLKSWHLVVGSLLDSEAKFQLDGTYELTAERAIADRWGYIIDEVYVSKKEVKNLVLSIVNDKLENMSITIPPNSITPEDLSQAVLDLIGSGGNVVNNPDEEDITSESLSNGTSVLKFKDRSYVEGTFNGLGEIILRKNQVGIVNLLEQVNINKPNTIYIIRYDFCLGGATITLPKNSTLKFEGGSIDNGTIIGNNSSIISDIDKTILGKDLIIEGTWNIEHIYDRWFAFDSSTDFLSNQIITNILALSNDNVYNTIHFDADRTYYFELPYKGRANLGDDVRPNYWKLNTEEYAFLRIFTGVTSNTHLIFNNTLQMIPTNQGAYFIFHIESKENIQISGTGTINADALNHKYTDPFAGTLYYGEWGHIFNIRSCNNIVIKDVTLAYAFGDAIRLGNVGLNIDGNKGCLAATKNVTIDGIKVLYARRNGISLGGNNYSISNVYFEGCGSEAIRGTAPKAAIDFENDYTEIDPSGICTNVVMSNCKFKDNAYDVSSTIRWDLGEVPTGQLVTINGCNFTAPLRLNKTRGLTFNDCHIVGISSHDNSISPWTVSEEWIFNNCNFDELNPYLVVSASDYKHQFNNCTYPQDIQCHKIFRGSLSGTRAIKFSIPKPISVGELEFVAICTNSSYSIAHLPINTTKYTIGNNTNLVDIRDIRIEARVDSYPRFSMYQQTPVFSYIDYNEDADNINIYFSLGGNITGSPLAGNTEVNIFMNSKTKYIVKEKPVSEGSTAGIYGGKWSEVSAITKTLINISEVPSTVVFPSREMYPNSTMSDLNQITNLKSQRMGTQIYVTDTSYRQPAYWDSTGLTWRTADGNRTLERRVATTEALNTLTAKLTESDRGYRVYTSVHSSYLTWDGIQWLNEDGSLYSDVKFINKFFTIERLNNAMSNSNVTYKIVGNIDLGGGTLTIVTNSTLDFQGGSFSNGTIIGNCKITGNVSNIFGDNLILFSTSNSNLQVIDSNQCKILANNSFISLSKRELLKVDDITSLFDIGVITASSNLITEYISNGYLKYDTTKIVITDNNGLIATTYDSAISYNVWDVTMLPITTGLTLDYIKPQMFSFANYSDKVTAAINYAQCYNLKVDIIEAFTLSKSIIISRSCYLNFNNKTITYSGTTALDAMIILCPINNQTASGSININNLTLNGNSLVDASILVLGLSKSKIDNLFSLNCSKAIYLHAITAIIYNQINGLKSYNVDYAIYSIPYFEDKNPANSFINGNLYQFGNTRSCNINAGFFNYGNGNTIAGGDSEPLGKKYCFVFNSERATLRDIMWLESDRNIRAINNSIITISGDIFSINGLNCDDSSIIESGEFNYTGYSYNQLQKLPQDRVFDLDSYIRFSTFNNVVYGYDLKNNNFINSNMTLSADTVSLIDDVFVRYGGCWLPIDSLEGKSVMFTINHRGTFSDYNMQDIIGVIQGNSLALPSDKNTNTFLFRLGFKDFRQYNYLLPILSEYRTNANIGTEQKGVIKVILYFEKDASGNLVMYYNNTNVIVCPQAVYSTVSGNLFFFIQTNKYNYTLKDIAIFSKQLSTTEFYNVSKVLDNAVNHCPRYLSGTTANRPTLYKNQYGFQYYDTTLGKLILWSGKAWTNLDGTTL